MDFLPASGAAQIASIINSGKPHKYFIPKIVGKVRSKIPAIGKQIIVVKVS